MIKKRLGDDKRVLAGITQTLKTLEYKMQQLQEEKEYDKADKVAKQIEKIKYDNDAQMEFYSRTAMKHSEVARRNKLANYSKDIAAGEKRAKLESELKASGSLPTTNDPFIRRETRAGILWNTGSKLAKEKERVRLKKLLDELKANGDIDEASRVTAQIEALDKNVAVAVAAGATIESRSSVSIQITATTAAAAPTATTTINNNNTTTSSSMLKENEWHVGRKSMDEIRARIKEKLGVDPYEVSRVDRRQRYLSSVCGSLPSIADPDGAAIRDTIRQGISLTSWFGMYDQQVEG